MPLLGPTTVPDTFSAPRLHAGNLPQRFAPLNVIPLGPSPTLMFLITFCVAISITDTVWSTMLAMKACFPSSLTGVVISFLKM